MYNRCMIRGSGRRCILEEHLKMDVVHGEGFREMLTVVTIRNSTPLTTTINDALAMTTSQYKCSDKYNRESLAQI